MGVCFCGTSWGGLVSKFFIDINNLAENGYWLSFFRRNSKGFVSD